MMVNYSDSSNSNEGCPVCSKSGKIAESKYAKVFFKQRDGKMPRLEFEMNGETESFTIKYCPQCGNKLW